MLFTLLAFALALGMIITFHEYGHYWVARRCGVKVLRFSVGFGKVLARRIDRHGTEWAISAIPLGGYVKMLDDAPADASPAAAAQAFNNKSIGQRMAIVVAGPVANLVLAALFYAALNIVGTQEPAAILAAPPGNTAAALAGFEAGDRIATINGKNVQSWPEVRFNLLDALTSGGQVPIMVDTASGIQRMRTLDLQTKAIEPDQVDLMSQAGLSLARPKPKVTQVSPDGPGARVGLQAGDVVVGVGSLKNPTADAMVSEIQAHAGQPIAMTVLRNGVALTLNVIPALETTPQGVKVGRIGVLLGAEFPMVAVRYGIFESVSRAVSRTLDTAWFSLKMMGRMVTGGVSLRNISGPVTIADYAGQTARIGVAAYVGFLALISVSIGVLNLLPIPMLDGGHLMYYVLEVARGKPVPEKWRDAGQRIGLGMLAALMGLAFFNDFYRLFS
ncbi:MAG: RIP metalloprotease RseP [Burkholderiaceae bacterium]